MLSYLPVLRQEASKVNMIDELVVYTLTCILCSKGQNYRNIFSPFMHDISLLKLFKI